MTYVAWNRPRRPVDRTPDLDGYTHFVPTAFNTGARDMLLDAVRGAVGAAATPVNCSDGLVGKHCALACVSQLAANHCS